VLATRLNVKSQNGINLLFNFGITLQNTIWNFTVNSIVVAENTAKVPVLADTV
jgi:hypothetical protein